MHIKRCKQNTKRVLFKLIASPAQKLNPKVINPNNHETNRYWEYRWGAKKTNKKTKRSKTKITAVNQTKTNTNTDSDEELGIGNSSGMRHR